jgi:hypothetical protein
MKLAKRVEAHDHHPTVTDDVSALISLSLEELREAWASRLGRSCPSVRSRDILSRALAYELQVRALGGLPVATRRRMDELARQFETDRSFTPLPRTALKTGSSVVREWRGERHEVRVVEHGFTYQGRAVRSLSEAAFLITGTKWNGHVFFGLTPRSGAKAQAQ